MPRSLSLCMCWERDVCFAVPLSDKKYSRKFFRQREIYTKWIFKSIQKSEGSGKKKKLVNTFVCLNVNERELFKAGASRPWPIG